MRPFAILLFSLFCGVAGAQTPQQAADMKAEVPALTEFHTVIYQLWHDAWPKKDTGLMKQLLPKVEAGVHDIAAALLPGILRERKAAWDAEVAALQSIAGDYRTAAAKDQTQPLVDAVEKLHMQYEKLVRVLRPSLKEMGDFHTVLYPLYHYYMPGDSVEKIQQSAKALKEKMAALKNAALPTRLQNQGMEFKVLKLDLSEAVDELASAAPRGDLKELRTAIEKVHERYQKLDEFLSQDSR